LATNQQAGKNLQADRGLRAQKDKNISVRIISFSILCAKYLIIDKFCACDDDFLIRN